MVFAEESVGRLPSKFGSELMRKIGELGGSLVGRGGGVFVGRGGGVVFGRGWVVFGSGGGVFGRGGTGGRGGGTFGRITWVFRRDFRRFGRVGRSGQMPLIVMYTLSESLMLLSILRGGSEAALM